METVSGTVRAPATANGALPTGSADAAFHETRAGWWMLGLVWVASAAYLGFHLRQGWTPGDASTLAEAADRVLRGQVPFRDFADAYTGGLTYLDALAFRLFGVNFFSLRIPLFLFFLGWVPSVYFIARRFAGTIGAGLVTLLSVAWSVPVYPEAMPSWYNLFFATWGALALIRYVETEKQRWLWVAGLCGGLSFLVKVIGLYFVAAAFLFFVYREISLQHRSENGAARDSLAYSGFVSIGLLSFVAVLLETVLQRPTVDNAIYFILPSASIAGFLLAEIWQVQAETSRTRFRRLFLMAVPFVMGALLPFLSFTAWLLANGVLLAWFRETFFVAPVHVLWDAAYPDPLFDIVGLFPAGFVFVVAFSRSSYRRLIARYGAAAVLCGLLVTCREDLLFRQLVGHSVRLLVPLLAVVAIVYFKRPGFELRADGQIVFVLTSTAIVCSLTQFPITIPLYFCYIAPLVCLALFVLSASRREIDRAVLGALLTFYLVFALWLRPPGYFDTMLLIPGETYTLRPLRLGRAGGLWTEARWASEYKKLIALVQAHARGDYIYCGPDCPQVYFLSGKLNPTGTIWDFLDPDFLDIPARTDRILESLASHGVKVVVIKRNTGQLGESGPIARGLRAALDTRYPKSETVGAFQVRWKPEQERNAGRDFGPPAFWGEEDGTAPR